MKATIDFDLPSEDEAHLDAIQGAKWKALLFDLEAWVTMRAMLDESVERQSAFSEIRRFVRDERHTAGLTFFGAENLREFTKEHFERCTNRINE